MAKLASSIVAAVLFVAVCYHSSIPGTTFAQATTSTQSQAGGNCNNTVNVSWAQKSITGMLGMHVQVYTLYTKW